MRLGGLRDASLGLLGQLVPRGLNNTLLTTVAVAADARFVFAGAQKGAQEARRGTASQKGEKKKRRQVGGDAGEGHPLCLCVCFSLDGVLCLSGLGVGRLERARLAASGQSLRRRIAGDDSRRRYLRRGSLATRGGGRRRKRRIRMRVWLFRSPNVDGMREYKHADAKLRGFMACARAPAPNLRGNDEGRSVP